MKYSQFENNIKSKFYNTTAMVDTNTLIANIHALDGDKNKKRPFIFYFTIFAVAALSLLLFNFNQNNSKNRILPATKKESKNEINNPAKHKIPTNEIKEKIVVSPAKPVALENKTKINLSSNINNVSKHKKTGNTTLKNSLSETTQIKTPMPDITQMVNTQTVNSDIHKSVDKGDLSSIEGVNKIHPFLSINSSFSSLKNKKLWGDPTDCYSFGPRYRFNWLLGVEIGLLKPFKSLSNKNAEPNLVFDVRKEHEKPLEGLQAAIFTKVIREDIPFFMKLGVSYTRITDRLKYKYSYIEHDTIQGIISITKSENGDTLTVIYGDIIRDITIDRNISQHYYFHLIDIPLTLGYRFGFKGFSLEAELGAMFNIRTGTTGNILNAPNTIVPVKDVNLFRTRLGFSYFAGLNIVFPVSHKGEMFASARFRYIPNQFSLSDNPIKQNYSLAGFHIGYMYNLTKRSYD